MEGPRVSFRGARFWRESLGAAVSAFLGIVVFVSVFVVGYYTFRDRSVYAELVDYLDKTISISKINYNHLLGFYKLNQKELDTLSEHKTYKTLMWCFLCSDLLALVLLAAVLLVYIFFSLESRTVKILFWGLLFVGLLFCLVEIHVFSFVLFPFSQSLPNRTEYLLSHAIPHNPGGLLQMENELGCTFNHNLYSSEKRLLNPRNTCDPYISSTLIPLSVLIPLLVTRLVPFVITVFLCVKRTPCSESVAVFMEKKRWAETAPKRLYVKKENVAPSAYHGEKRKDDRYGMVSPGLPFSLPRIPSPSIDHSISYNNAAYLATCGLNSSSSEISRIEIGTAHRTSGSIMSEV